MMRKFYDVKLRQKVSEHMPHLGDIPEESCRKSNKISESRWAPVKSHSWQSFHIGRKSASTAPFRLRTLSLSLTLGQQRAAHHTQSCVRFCATMTSDSGTWLRGVPSSSRQTSSRERNDPKSWLAIPNLFPPDLAKYLKKFVSFFLLDISWKYTDLRQIYEIFRNSDKIMWKSRRK